jgi:hypothetical protein
MATQLCPICSAPVSPNPRYPRYVCRDCVPRASSFDGRPVRFGNSGTGDGVEARYVDGDELYESRQCLIDGVRCWAREAHFGGVVIQIVD